jgi:aspartyl protease family protein
MRIPEGVRAIAPVVGVFALLLGVMTWLFGDLLERRHKPNRAVDADAERVVLEAGPAGQYRAPGRINGERVPFLVDTGASHVAIPGAVADRLGLERGAQIRVSTAGGVTTAYNTRIDEIALGGLRVRDVRGSIVPDMSGDAVLLGMTFLRHVRLRQREGELLLEPPRERAQ